MTDNDVYVLWLTSLPMLNSNKIASLLSRFGSAADVYNAQKSELKGLNFINAQDMVTLCDGNKDDIVAQLLRGLEKHNVKYVSIENSLFPRLLRAIDDCPFGLYYKGSLPESDSALQIAAVGSRKCTEYGEQAAYRLCYDLAEKGVTIVSGMAKGIDGMAHRAALDAGASTLAVLGNGLDICYPTENDDLYERIPEKGCILTEYQFGTPPIKTNFPRRNRIISGLGHGVVVIEAATQSGTSITVEYAISQGREIFAVPGNIFSAVSAGTNMLIRDGAIPVTCAEDILYEFFFGNYDRRLLSRKLEIYDKEAAPFSRRVHKINTRSNNVSTRTGYMADSDSDQKLGEVREPKSAAAYDTSMLEQRVKDIYLSMTDKPMSVDDIISVSKAPVQTVLYAMTILEIYGLTISMPGGMFVRKP